MQAHSRHIDNITHIIVDFCHCRQTVCSFKARRGCTDVGYLGRGLHTVSVLTARHSESQAALRPAEPHNYTPLTQSK